MVPPETIIPDIEPSVAKQLASNTERPDKSTESPAVEPIVSGGEVTEQPN